VKYHLPCSESPADEFQTPSGEWFTTLRAIAFDGWLLWKHALPEDPLLWPAMDHDVFVTIEALARRVHSLHQLLPDYRRLTDTPFAVSRWWDPTDDTGEWLTGERALLRINGYTARDVEQEIPPRLKGQLKIQARSLNWLEISLPEGPHSSPLTPCSDENL
jgi:hypothetical protein